MKRISIDSRTMELIEDEDIRPSLLRKLRKNVITSNIYIIEDLCKKTEEELLFLDCFDTHILGIIKKKLQDNGLSLGMTSEELLQYEDAEYDRLHPKEDNPQKYDWQDYRESKEIFPLEDWVKIVRDNSPENQHVSNQGDETTKVPLTNELHRRIMSQHEKKVRANLKERLAVRGNVKMIAEDIEFMKLHLFRTFFAEQPWYIRLFKTWEERISLARKEAESLSMAYMRDLIEDIVKSRQQSFSKELTECWDKNWSVYLEELKK